MNFIVEVVPDDALPAGIEQVMVERRHEPPVLVLAESVAGVWSFVSDWADDGAEDCGPIACAYGSLRAVS